MHSDPVDDMPTYSSVAEPPTSHIYFKDLKLLAHDEDSEEEESEATNSCGNLVTLGIKDDKRPNIRVETPGGGKGKRKGLRRVDRQKLIVILVGLPARGKTFLCNKLMCYLNWLGHPTRHFNVGSYRRKQRPEGVLQDASFFDYNNKEGMEARERALMAALEDLELWLESDEAQVAIFDATNSTERRRTFLRSRFHGRWQYLFIESICHDQQVLEANYQLKMLHSSDYKGMHKDAALSDFKDRIKRYEEVYETITDRTLHYVKLIDMVTGRGYMDVNRISGYIPGKMVFFLMQVCKAGVARPRRIWLTRHGESEYNVKGLIGGNSRLSTRGQMYANILPDILASRIPCMTDGSALPVSVWTSTLQRTIITAQGLPYPKVQWKVLDEIQAGTCDGMTYEQIALEMPVEFAARKHDKLRYRYPSGESYMDVIQRLEPVITEVERERECVIIVAHQAVLRALYGYFMNKPSDSIPRIDIPLHTIMELTPKADGTMSETRFYVDVDKAIAWEAEALANAGVLQPPKKSSSSSVSKSSVSIGSELKATVASSSTGALASSSTGGEEDGSSPDSSVYGVSPRGTKHVTRSLSLAEMAAVEVVRQVQTLHSQSSGDQTPILAKIEMNGKVLPK